MRIRINRCDDGAQGVASSSEASDVDAHQDHSGQSKFFVCKKNLQAIAGQGDHKKKKQARKNVMFDCGSDRSTSCEGFDDERGEEQDRSENGSEDAEECVVVQLEVNRCVRWQRVDSNVPANSDRQ